MVDAVKILGSLLASGALSRGTGGGVLGNVLGAALGGGRQSGGGGGVADLLGSLMGGGGQGQSGSPIGAVLGSLLGGGQQQQAGGGGLGGLGGLLGSVLGGGQPAQAQAHAPMSQGGGMGDLLGSLLGGAQGQGGAGGGLGSLLTGALAKYAQGAGAPAAQAMPAGMNQAQANDQAMLIVKAMINAAKSDGKVDQAESQKIMAKLGQLDPEEVNFIRNEISAPLDVNGFVRSVPRGMEQQVYAMSLMAIDLDTQQEAGYLQQLAQGFNLSGDVCNQIHDQLGAPKIFS